MDGPRLAYAAYMLFFLLLCGSAIVVPLMAFNGDAGWAYDAFAPTCHQKLSRSLCLFHGPEGGPYWIADCTPQDGRYVGGFGDHEEVGIVNGEGATGYKMPYCSRDFGIYGAMLLAGLAYPFVRRLDERALYPAAWLLLAIVPIAIDGGLQIATEIDKPLFHADLLPFDYESTNAVRLATGAIAGFASSFYAIPILANLFGAGAELKNSKAKNR
jgi:uncharacterized membrane protein